MSNSQLRWNISDFHVMSFNFYPTPMRENKTTEKDFPAIAQMLAKYDRK